MTSEVPESELTYATIEVGPPAPTPQARVGRTAVQVLVAVLVAIPPAAAALTGAGVEVDPGVMALAVGIPGAAVIIVSAAQNAYDQARGKG